VTGLGDWLLASAPASTAGCPPNDGSYGVARGFLCHRRDSVVRAEASSPTDARHIHPREMGESGGVDETAVHRMPATALAPTHQGAGGPTGRSCSRRRSPGSVRCRGVTSRSCPCGPSVRTIMSVALAGCGRARPGPPLRPPSASPHEVRQRECTLLV
jgi:hypothetical protein